MGKALYLVEHTPNNTSSTMAESFELADIPPPVPEKDEAALELSLALRSRVMAREDDGKLHSERMHEVKLQSQRYDVLLYRKLTVSFILWLLMLVINMLGLFSCTGDLLASCYPQYTLRIQVTNESGRKTLHSIQSGLEVLLYFSKSVTSAEESMGDRLASMLDNYLHLGPAPSDEPTPVPIPEEPIPEEQSEEQSEEQPEEQSGEEEEEEEHTHLGGLDNAPRDLSWIMDMMSTATHWLSGTNHSEVTDTFSPRLSFWFNFHGFCRYDHERFSKSCESAPGMDVFSLVVRDLGIQFAVHADNEDPETASKRMVRIYQRMVDNLNDRYDKLLLDDNKAGEYNMKSYKDVRSLRNARYFSEFSMVVVLIGLWASIIATVVCGHLLMLYSSESNYFQWFQRHMNFVTKLLVVLTLGYFLMELPTFLGDMYLYVKLRKLFTKLAIADFNIGLGFCFTLMNVFLGAVQLMIQLRMLQRHVKL